MNKRQVELLLEIYRSNGEVALNDLAKEYCVSPKTIRMDIERINVFLKNDQNEIIRIENNKISYSGQPENYYEKLSKLDFNSYIASREERIKLILLFFMLREDLPTVQQCADFLKVSRITVMSDIEMLNQIYRSYPLKLQGVYGQGMRITAEEVGLRDLYFDFLDDDFLFCLFLNNYENEYPEVSRILNIATETINRQEEKSFFHYTERGFHLLSRYLLLYVIRRRQGLTIEKTKQQQDNDYLDSVYHGINQIFGFENHEKERQYLLKIGNSLKVIQAESNQSYILNIQVYVQKFIDRISKDLNIPLYSDFTLLVSLTNHLIRINQDHEVPFFYEIENIKKENHTVYEAVKNTKYILEDFCKREISYQELLYIVLYIVAAMERWKKNANHFRVLLVCNFGLATGQILKEKLQSKLNLRIVDIIPKHILHNYEPTQYDFIVSTVYLEGAYNYVKISTEINAADIQHISQKSMELKEKVILGTDGEEEYRQKLFQCFGEEKELYRDLKAVLDRYLQNKNQEKNSLIHFLTPDFIQTDIRAGSWQEAIEKASEPLLEQGYIAPSYIRAMIDNIMQNGPYMVVYKGIIVPHAGIEDGCYKVGMNMAVLDEPIVFGAGELDPIKYIIVFCTTNSQIHLKAFFALMNLLKDEMFLKELETAKSNREIYELLVRYQLPDL